MNASFIITGAEILSGIRSDALLQPLSSMLASRGVSTLEVRMIPDSPQKLCAGIIELAEFSDLIVVTGGLGLTPDDTTHIAIQMLETKKSIRVGFCSKHFTEHCIPFIPFIPHCLHQYKTHNREKSNTR